ncbi:hypothetical protein ColTof3_12209 [Colletotrichum tofieldiae]|nr:hypothetical protein ColTof3_12209 [Colletotrichum tofieldiae]
MSEEQWLAVANVAEQASRKRPNQNPQASFEKHLSVFRNIWWILFPEARFEPTSPFCEDIYCAHIGVLSDILFNERASSALGRDQPLSDPEYRATGAEVREMMLQVFSIVAGASPSLTERITMTALSARTTTTTARPDALSEGLTTGGANITQRRRIAVARTDPVVRIRGPSSDYLRNGVTRRKPTVFGIG